MLLYMPPYTKWVTRAVMKVVLVHLIRAYVEPMDKLHAFLTLSRYGGKESNCNTGTHWKGRWLYHTTSLNTLKKRKATTYWESNWFLSSSTQPSHCSACSQKCEKQPLVLSCLSTWNNAAPTGWIFHIWYLKTFKKMSRKFKAYSNLTAGTLHEDLWTFMIISHSLLLRMRNVSHKICRQN
jgi:hypothetical protein